MKTRLSPKCSLGQRFSFLVKDHLDVKEFEIFRKKTTYFLDSIISKFPQWTKLVCSVGHVSWVELCSPCAPSLNALSQKTPPSSGC